MSASSHHLRFPVEDPPCAKTVSRKHMSYGCGLEFSYRGFQEDQLIALTPENKNDVPHEVREGHRTA